MNRSSVPGDKRPTTLYLTRNGLMEPLGQSQVLAYVRRLSTEYRITLITFEKPDDWADAEGVQAVHAECQRLGIRWLPQRFRHKPRMIAPALDMLRFAVLGWREVRRGADLIHARSYIPAAVSLFLCRMTRLPFIFDMRSLWPEELITAGRLHRGSLVHRAITWIERRCIARGEVVSVTEAAVGYLRETYAQELNGKTVHVIPTCADLQRFVPSEENAKEVTYGCVGTVLSGWFRFDWLAALFVVVAGRTAEAKLEIVTHDDSELVQKRLVAAGVPVGRVRVYAVKPSEMPAVVQRQTASVMFFNEGLCNLGSSPTRMAEVLACGRPVISNAGVGDVARIIEHYRVGIIVRDKSEAGMRSAMEQLEVLLSDPALGGRCRRAAEEVFSLEAGAAAYRRIYQGLIGRQASISATAQDDDGQP